MSLRERQKIKYHTISVEFWSEFVELSKEAQRTFAKLLDHIDKKDNCLQLSYTEFIESSGLFVYVVKRGLRELRHRDFVRKDIIDIQGVWRYMVNPKAAWSYTGSEHEFALKVYNLGSHKAASDMRQVEKNNACFIDPITGEITDTFGRGWRPFEPLIDHYE